MLRYRLKNFPTSQIQTQVIDYPGSGGYQAPIQNAPVHHAPVQQAPVAQSPAHQINYQQYKQIQMAQPIQFAQPIQMYQPAPTVPAIRAPQPTVPTTPVIDTTSPLPIVVEEPQEYEELPAPIPVPAVRAPHRRVVSRIDYS